MTTSFESWVPVCISIENFRGIQRRQEIKPGRGLTLIVGANGAGKSSIASALEWCLFGPESMGRTASGIAERGDWVPANHTAVGDVVVSIQFEMGERSFRLTRCRKRNASLRSPDQVQLELPDGRAIQDSEAFACLSDKGMPDWKTWKRSYCQHQEQSRLRITESGERSMAIAGMLGLDEYRGLASDLKSLPIRQLEQCAERALDRIDRAQQKHAERPSLELRDLDVQLAQYGISVSQTSATAVADYVDDLLSQAHSVANELGMSAVKVPSVDEGMDVLLRWARSWPALVNGKIGDLNNERADSLRRLQSMEAGLGALDPARRAADDARSNLQRLRAEVGSFEELHLQLESVSSRRQSVADALGRHDAHRKLLDDAVEVISQGTTPGHCPVCDAAFDDLERKIRDRLASQDQSDHVEELERLTERKRVLTEQLERIEMAETTADMQRKKVKNLEEQVAGQMVDSSGDVNSDSLAQWRRVVERFDALLALAQSHLDQHRQRCEALSLMLRARRAIARSEAVAADIGQSAQFMALQDSLDRASGTVADIAALAEMARSLESDRAEQQIKAVNRSIGLYFSMITGVSDPTSIKVHSRRTANAVSYQLLDDHQRPVTGALNQASFNALSLACLFASAQSRAEQGLPQILVLDEPGQSLDEEHQLGLVKALAACSKLMPVIVATIPGPLAEALARKVEQTEDGTDVALSVLRMADGSDTQINVLSR